MKTRLKRLVTAHFATRAVNVPLRSRRTWKDFCTPRLLQIDDRPTGAGRTRATSAGTDLERRHRIATWVAREVISHEGRVRAWLARQRVAEEDSEELIQEGYYRLSMLDSVDHIDRPDAYFFSVVRHLLIRRLKRERVVPIDAIAEIESYSDDRNPTPEQEAGARLDYARMLDFMAALPERCRTIVRLRKIEGWSQKEIAAHFEMSEKAVEKQVWVGVKAIQQAWSDADRKVGERLQSFENGGRR